MRDLLFQYQDIFEGFPPIAAPEVVTPDKWLGVVPEPVRRRLRRQPESLFFTDIFPAPAPANFEWLTGVESRPRRKERRDTSPSLFFTDIFPAQAPANFEWLTGVEARPRAKERRDLKPYLFFTDIFPAAATPVNFEWLTGVESKPRPRRKPDLRPSVFFLDIFPPPPVVPSMASWHREPVIPVRRRKSHAQIAQTTAFVYRPEFTVVTFTPTQGAAGVPSTRNKLFLRLPDLGTLSLRSDRLTGSDNEARLRAPSALEDNYELVMPTGLPAASRPIVVDSAGNMSYGSRELRGTATWDPPSIASGAKTTTTVTVTGAAVGDPAYAGFSTAIPAGITISAHVTATDTVTITLFNIDAGATDLASGTVTAVVLKS